MASSRILIERANAMKIKASVVSERSQRSFHVRILRNVVILRI